MIFGQCCCLGLPPCEPCEETEGVQMQIDISGIVDNTCDSIPSICEATDGTYILGSISSGGGDFGCAWRWIDATPGDCGLNQIVLRFVKSTAKFEVYFQYLGICTYRHFFEWQSSWTEGNPIDCSVLSGESMTYVTTQTGVCGPNNPCDYSSATVTLSGA